MWGILGRGFGLYGYLPALLANGEPRVGLPERYRDALWARKELAPLCERVHFAADEDCLFQEVDALVIAQRPQDLPPRLERLLMEPRLRHFVLEKPLGPTPAVAAELLACIEAAGKTCRAGYTFRWAPWAQAWHRAMRSAGATLPWSVHWQFKAHHYLQDGPNWKRVPEQGGGALRFYGIHLLALLAEWGYSGAARSIVSSDGQGGAAAWQAELTGPALPNVHISVDSDSATSGFSIGAGANAATALFCGLDPFDEALSKSPWPRMDRRCSYLQAMLAEPMPEGTAGHDRLHAANALWAAVEARTEVQPAQKSQRFVPQRLPLA